MSDAAPAPREAQAKAAAPPPAEEKKTEDVKKTPQRPAITPVNEQLSRDDFVRARNCCLAVAFVVVAGLVAIGARAPRFFLNSLMLRQLSSALDRAPL